MASLKFPIKAVKLIVTEEVGSEAEYNKSLIHPTWPEGESGVTIGIGYDLGYASKDQIKADWGDKVNGNHLVQLLSASGYKGLQAKAQIGPLMRLVTISYQDAMDVFIKRNIPQSYKLSVNTYPGLDKLNPDTIGAIVSLVYNRGTALVGKNREGMAALKPLIASADYTSIADTIEDMKHIWEGGEDEGLVERRVLEANMVRVSIADSAQSKDSDYIIISL